MAITVNEANLVYSLRMAFGTDLGKETVITIDRVRRDITASEVREVMETLIANPVFVMGLSSGAGAEIVARAEQKLF